MISPVNGEVGFDDGLCVACHATLGTLAPFVVSSRDLPVPGWMQVVLGLHTADHGDFQVEASVGAERRVEALFLSHRHPFYEVDTPEDSERRAYHEGVIAIDLRGQSEFPWGRVFCRFDPLVKYDWLVIVYNPFKDVPLHARAVEKVLMAHELIPPARPSA
jgi:hypothetical protein